MIDYEQEQSAAKRVASRHRQLSSRVYANQITSKVDAVGRDLSSDNSQDNNQLLIGYINITLDLDALRQWFRQNLPLLLALSLGAGLLMLMIFWYLRRMLNRLPRWHNSKCTDRSNRQTC